MDHDQLVVRAVHWLRSVHRCKTVHAEFRTKTISGQSPDAIGWQKDGWSVLVECKTSRDDFRRNWKKPVHKHTGKFMGQERWFLLSSKELYREDDLGEWGVAYMRGPQIRILKRPSRARDPKSAKRRSPLEASRQLLEVRLLTAAARRWELGIDYDSKRAQFTRKGER